MTFQNIIRQLSRRQEIQDQPPVLIDIGASKEIHKHWKPIAHFSVCLAFDADSRDFEYLEEENAAFKKLIKVNKIVVADTGGERKKDFYLTRSPYCSSLLQPDLESLKDYHYASLFEVVEKEAIEVVELPLVLNKTGLEYIDWFKSDSQGTDLRLLRSLDEGIREKIIVLEMEPGFIDAYKGEDKLTECISYMEGRRDFFLTGFEVKGPLRIREPLFRDVFPSALSRKIAAHILPVVPGWAEIGYMNKLERESDKPRDYMLAWLFSTLKDHHEIAYGYAHSGGLRFEGDSAFWNGLKKYSEKKLKGHIQSFDSISKLARLAFNKYFG